MTATERLIQSEIQRLNFSMKRTEREVKDLAAELADAKERLAKARATVTELEAQLAQFLWVSRADAGEL